MSENNFYEIANYSTAFTLAIDRNRVWSTRRLSR